MIQTQNQTQTQTQIQTLQSEFSGGGGLHGADFVDRRMIYNILIVETILINFPIAVTS